MLAFIDTVHDTVTRLAAIGRLEGRDLSSIVIIDELEIAVPEEVAELIPPVFIKMFTEGRQLYKDMKKAGLIT